ncbi:MAG: FKBP-type peptidyl-prolyl cis-trans isomerase [Bacteroidota bacterium]|nr:FKBP-type peptidyl-prolyl cis-trans isomerase [Ferruginibacter sp.]
MRKLFFLLAVPFLMTACIKDEPNNTCQLTLSKAVAPASEIASVQNYLAANSITATQHPSGLYYVVNNPGAALTPTACSAVTVKYVGRLTNGSTFEDSNTNNPNGITFTLGQLIAGWQIGIPLVQKGGSITLYIPPSLGYGQNASGPIPGNSILIFTIELVNVQ